MSIKHLLHRVRQARQALSRIAAEKFIEPAVVNSLRLQQQENGSLPLDPLQRAAVLYYDATTGAMESTIPDGADGGAYERAQQELAQAAAEYNRQLSAHGLPANMPGRLP